ncbi:MAG TPA: ImcF-related family protein [Longimicrobiaceae bacterium]|nr:ImcF-related family protein [Longimicrobiaceae bacterium]
MNSKLRWPLSIGTFLLFVLGAWASIALLDLSGGDAWLLGGGLVVLGIVAAALVFMYLRGAKAPPQEGKDGIGDEVDARIAAARATLSGARLTGTNKLGKLPVLLVLGPSGGTKTTAITRSGLDPELLAGDVHRGDEVVPTSDLNIWYAQGTVFVEAGGGFLEKPSGIARMIRHIQPSRLAATFGRGAQAPRAALVCFPCDELLKPGSGEAVPAAARKLRSALAELSRKLGIRLPVYVLFTKADRLPYFGDYVRSLSQAEANEVLGTTLPIPADHAAGAYAEKESQRLTTAFSDIFRSLSLKRLDVLPRETQEDIKGGAYEFPREFRKASGLAVEFLLELCKPQQLSASPFLRGFYFTGVRAVIVGDSAASPTAENNLLGRGDALGATSVFNPSLLKAAQPAPVARGSRKVPEWLFLKRVFGDVILEDRAAMRVTSGGTRVNLFRRALLASATVLFLILSIGLATSYFSNRSLIREAVSATSEVEALATDGAGLASLEELRRLEELRAETAELRGYEEEGHPWRLGWGLYTGSAILPELRGLYFDRFDGLIWRRTRSGLFASLTDLPESPDETSKFGRAYDALKAHLVTTSHPRESSSAFLTPVLLEFWRGAAEPDEERMELVRNQLDFFADELPFGNPYTDEPRAEMVARTRSYLRQFSGPERFYRVLISEASAANEAIAFNELYPGTEAVIRNSYEVPGAFTEDGWEFVHARLANLDSLFAREDWVIGGQPITPEDRAQLATELRAKYVADYSNQWQQFLSSASVVRPAGASDAARKLERLSGNQSPLLEMFAVASRNTDVDSTTVGKAFQPVHQVMPPGTTDRYIVDANKAYIAALGNLHAALDQVASAAGPARAQALMQASGVADRVMAEARVLAQNFSIEGDAQAVGSTVQRLMETPVSTSEALIGALPSAELNQKGAAFCRSFAQAGAKYPFNPQAATVATIDEVSQVFQTGNSVLWSFYDETLQDLIVRQGSQYGARVGATPRPSAGFVEFFGRAAAVSEALYDGSGGGPSLTFSLRPQTSNEIPEITVSIDDQSQTFTRTFAASKRFTWNGPRAQSARITADVGGTPVTVFEGQGTWAVFRLFQQAQWERQANDRYTVRWPLPGGGTLSAELILEAGTPPILMRDYLASLTCTPTIVR